MAYFDWNATAPMLAEAQAALLDGCGRLWANPSTPYRSGARVRLALDAARATVAARFGVTPGRVVFTSGATESANGLLRAAALRAGADGEAWISAVEHPCVGKTVHACFGPQRVRVIPVGADGRADADWIRDQLKRNRPALVAVMAASNVTGVLQPWREILALCREAGAPFFCDAVQWIGKESGADPATGPDPAWAECAGVGFSAHKLGGPKGVGCLIAGDEWTGLAIQTGGSQEQGMRAGTENVPGILAMVAALEHRLTHLPTPAQRAARDAFEARLQAEWPGQVQVHGAAAPRLWNTSLLALPTHRAARWIARLDRLGYAVSSGSACASSREGPASMLEPMGVGAEAAARTLRISAGWETAPEDWQGLAGALLQAGRELDREAPDSGPGRVIEI